MCQKTNTTKRFFLLLHHPVYHKPNILRVFPDRLPIQNIIQESVYQDYLTKEQIERLKVPYTHNLRGFFLPINIPRDWFIH